jgi:long-chain acyl-CoA synthetase
LEAGAPATDSPATLIYTSGTTGSPKAVLYSHRQILVAADAILESFPGLSAGENMLCWLPMAHLYQRMLNFAAAQRGAILCFVEDPRTIAECLRETNPEVFVGVPRVFEKIHDGIRNQAAAQSRPARALFAWALKIGGECARRLRAGQTPSRTLRWKQRLADVLVLRRIRGLFGKNIRFLISGSAPLPAQLPEFFHALGLVTLEAYGVSENTVPLAANRPGDYRFGSVGRPFAANEIRLAADGEVLVRGPGLFRGYEGDREADERFTADGFYQTGDLGRFDEDGYLWLKGRKSEIIKTSTGRKLSPFKIEGAYRKSPLIAQIAVFGDGRERPAALVVLDEAVLAQYWNLSGLPSAASEEMRRSDFARELTKRELERCGEELAPHERIADFAVLEKSFAVESGELTSNLKLRRQFIAAKYAKVIDGFYADVRTRGTRRRRTRPLPFNRLSERKFNLEPKKRESR